jgi:hypothetical protein
MFSERLWPSPGIWAASIGFGAALGLIPAPISSQAGVIVAIVGVAGLVALLVVTTPALSVTEDTFVAGRAHVPTALLGAVEVLDATQMRQARGVGLDARAYLCMRGWLPAGAKVILNDPEDPTPYWLVSSRRPEALALALRHEIERASRSDRSD